MQVRSGAVRRRARTFADYTPRLGLVPKLPATFLKLVKPGQVKRLVHLEAELTARGITGWVSREDGGTATPAELRRLLPTINYEGVDYLEGGVIGDYSEPGHGDQADDEGAEPQSWLDWALGLARIA